ncbi:hypothetical protein [Sphingomonas sp. SORGH_AS_0879]|uniref:hypothetical protein n=1 Tax=Sphingomonas sp. SORGH_AS_0879 TaxID=3041790 RepID=UPI002788D522|nr:hypothetical protein [Sphingomonas sp. SORGH_AS_0879]MDQ1230715.1 hypothetical protein [Sphingomonas sp. SORGH_AS_0879]
MHIYRIHVGNKFHTASLLVASPDEGSALSAVENFLQSEEVREMERREIEWSKEVESKEIVSESDHRYATFGHPVERCDDLYDQNDGQGPSFVNDLLVNPGSVIVDDSWNNG